MIMSTYNVKHNMRCIDIDTVGYNHIIDMSYNVMSRQMAPALSIHDINSTMQIVNDNNCHAIMSLSYRSPPHLEP